MLRNKIVRGAAVGAAAYVVVSALRLTGALDPLEWKAWDLRSRLFADKDRASKDIALVLVDQYSLDFYRKQSVSWPWPRQLYAALVDYLTRGGARACFFDIEMSEPSVYGTDDDRILAEAMVRAGNVVFPVALSGDEKESDPEAVGLVRRFSKPAPSAATPSRYRWMTAPLPEYLRAAKGVGNVSAPPDPDGIYRRISLDDAFVDLIVPSVPEAIAALTAGLDPRAVPRDRDGNMIIRFHGPAGTYRAYPAATLINSWARIQENAAPQVPPSEFAGKTVLVGLSAVGLHDLKSSPLSSIVSGVEIQAAALDTLLNRSFFKTTDPVLTAILVLFLSILAAISVTLLVKIRWIVLAFAAFLLLPVAAAALAFLGSRWLELVYPAAGTLLSLAGASLLNYGVEGKERRFIKGVFHHYLSPAVIERIIEDPGRLALGGEEREITSFFSDVAGFTAISESLSAPDLVALLNAYLSEMTDIILDRGGTLDKYEGDAIVAFWNAPLDDPAHPLRAVQAALTCRRRLAELAPEFERRFGRALRMRIGLNTGPAVVGNMGSKRRFDYTAMGDTVNLAARLEGAGKFYGVTPILGEATAGRVRDEILVREIDIVRVVGRTAPVRIFEPVGERSAVPAGTAEAVEAFGRAVSEYRSGNWARAEGLFLGLGEDPPARMYIERCRELQRVRPAEDWSAVVDLRSK
jgi:adenylate cyclase